MAERPALRPGPPQADPGRIQGPLALLEHWRHRLARPGLEPPLVRDAAFGPLTVEAKFGGFTAGSAYGRALRPARPAGRPPALTIHVIDGAACGVPRPRLAWRTADFGPKRIVPGWSGRDHTTYLLRSEGGVAVAAWAERRAVVWLPSAESVPWYERAAPFRWLLDGLAARRGMTMLHAAAVGRGGAGVLLAGRGGSGKSTLALACVGRGLDYVGDDYCLLSLDPEPQVHGLYDTAKWRRDAAVVPDWLAGVAPHALDGGERKNILHLDRIRPAQLAERLTVKAVVVPVVSGGARAVLERIPPSLALRHLAASTLAQAEADEGRPVELMGRLVRAVPAYRLSMPRDLDDSVAAITSLLVGASAA